MKYMFALTLTFLVCGVSMAQVQTPEESAYERGFSAGLNQGEKSCPTQQTQAPAPAAKTYVNSYCICDSHGTAGTVIKTDVYSDGTRNSHTLYEAVPTDGYAMFTHSCEWHAANCQ